MGGCIEQNPWKPTVRRGPIAAEHSSPGPAIVKLPSYFGNDQVAESNKKKSPSFTIGGRYNQNVQDNSPGPKFNTRNLSRTGPTKSTACSISGRHQSHTEDKTPGPGAYGPNPDKMHTVVLPNSFKYSFGTKPEKHVVVDTPAPNAYRIPYSIPIGENKYPSPDKPSAPSFTIQGRHNIPKHEIFPGPGAYNEPSPDVYKTKSPSYSVSFRTPLPVDHSIVPGPGAHCPEKVVLDSSPRYSFGIKHSPYIVYNKDDFQKPPRSSDNDVDDSEDGSEHEPKQKEESVDSKDNKYINKSFQQFSTKQGSTQNNDKIIAKGDLTYFSDDEESLPNWTKESFLHRKCESKVSKKLSFNMSQNISNQNDVKDI